MTDDFEKMALKDIRNLFLAETSAYFASYDTETPEQHKVRRDRILAIEKALEEKKIVEEKKIKIKSKSASRQN